jgi:hypothetical protein
MPADIRVLVAPAFLAEWHPGPQSAVAGVEWCPLDGPYDDRGHMVLLLNADLVSDLFAYMTSLGARPDEWRLDS